MAATGTEASGSGPGAPEQRSAARERLAARVPQGEELVAVIVGAVVAGVLIWWAWKQGGYFASVFLPGAIVLFCLLTLLLIAAPFRARLGGPARIAVLAILALSAWTLLSMLWSPSRDGALQDAEQAVLFAGVYALGLWASNLSRRRTLLPLGVIAVLGGAIGIVITITLAGATDVPRIFHDDATLRFPIGYRNAEAAFLLICLWPAVVLAAEGKIPWQLRALLIASATMLLELVVLSESRGSAPAAAVALTVLVLLSPRRLRIATYLAIAALPVLPALPALLDIFQHGGSGPGLIPLMRDAAKAIAITSLASLALASICLGFVEPRLRLGEGQVRLISRIVAGVAVAAVAIGGTVFMAKKGGPLEFVDQRVHEFRFEGNPNLQSQGTRFGVNVGSNRNDFWRVSLDRGAGAPIGGEGAGSFGIVYLKDRESDESPQDPHSVEMLMWSELGLVGLLLWAAFIVAAALAALRSRRLGLRPAALVAGALTSGAYWLMHSSYDWFWNYPGLTAPAVFLLGAAAAPGLGEGDTPVRARGRWVAAAPFVVAALIAVPLFLSQRYANEAYDEYPGNAAAALEDLDRAADLNPYDPAPLLAKGVIQDDLGDEPAALAAFRDAADREPEGYAAHFYIARTLAAENPVAALVAARTALDLNPLDPRTRLLERRLERETGSGEGKNETG